MDIKTLKEQRRAGLRKEALRLWTELDSVRKVAEVMGMSKTWVADAINRELSTAEAGQNGQ